MGLSLAFAAGATSFWQEAVCCLCEEVHQVVGTQTGWGETEEI